MPEQRQYTSEERAAHRAFAEAHWPWALHVARNYRPCGLDWEESRSVASITLMKAARKFDPAMGYRPSTYVGVSVRRELVRAARANRLIHAPAYLVERKASAEKHPEFTAAARRTFRPLSLDHEHRDGLPFKDMIAARDEPEPAADAEDLQALRAAIGRLPERLAMIVRGRLEGRTFEDLARAMGRSKERIRQLHDEAVDLLRRDLTRSQS